MPGLRAFLLKRILKTLKSRSQFSNIIQTRVRFEKTMLLFKSHFAGLSYQPFEIENIKCEWIIPDNSPSNKVLLFFHGGGYAVGSINTHRALVSDIAKQAGIKALLFDYRLAPEYPYPAAIEDCVMVYKWLLQQGYPPAQIAFAGDSAGGGLCIGTVLYLRDNHIALPKCIIGMSPWLDLSLSGETLLSKKDDDLVLVFEGFPIWSKTYLADADPKSPYASPIFHSLHGLPPTYIQVGGDEMLLSDSQRFANKAQQEGVNIRLEIFPGMFHVFQGYWRVLSVAKQANKKVGEFLRFQLNSE